jgi:predicted alpha/beta-fold hydrolase
VSAHLRRHAGDDGFRPHPLLTGGHRQTLLGRFVRRSLRWSAPAEDLIAEAGDEVRLLARATWQPDPKRPALVLLHGLGGSSESAYVISLGRLALERGWSVVRMNMRGSGDGERVCPLLYNAGLDEDLLAVLGAVARRAEHVAVAGFSLGASLVALAVGRGAARLPAPVLGAVAISPPLDLSACTDALEAPANRFYQRYYVGKLQNDYRRRQRLRPDLFAAGREAGIRTVREFDERITAPHGGFRDAAEYYARSSAGPWLARVERPLLVLAAADDPVIPIASVTRWPLSPTVTLQVTATGGHVGFLAPSRAPGRFWAADRAMAFLEGC